MSGCSIGKTPADPGAGAGVLVEEAGTYQLASASYAPIQGEEGRYVEVEVSPIDLPIESVNESIRIIYLRRHCLDYTIRNIGLVNSRVWTTAPLRV